MEEQLLVASADVGSSSTGEGVFSGTPLCTLVIPNTLLLRLHNSESGNIIAAINENIRENMVTLDTSCTQLEGALKRATGKLSARMKACKGSRDRRHAKEGSTNVMVGVGETIAHQELQHHLEVRIHTCISHIIK